MGKCSGCKFMDSELEEVTECHRYPPHPQYGYPVISNDDWCGEFRTRMPHYDRNEHIRKENEDGPGR